MSRRVLVLRPEPGASETLQRGRQLGLDTVAIPLFHIEPVEWQVPEPGGFDGLLLTSANGVRCAGEGLQSLRGLKAYAVGEATAAAAREAGLDIASTGEASVARLLGSIEPDLRLLHLCGEERAEAPDARQRITALPVYRAVPADADLSRAAGAVALIHSPRAGRRFAELVGNRSSIAIAAISQAAADAAGDGWERVEAADNPTDEALLALAARLCNIPAPQ
ncbi:MAG TPA: uroporphyrinogen-III synthase [Sphingomicrobium sp.]